MADLPQIVNTDNVIIKSPTDVVTTATKLSGLQISEKGKSFIHAIRNYYPVDTYINGKWVIGYELEGGLNNPKGLLESESWTYFDEYVNYIEKRVKAILGPSTEMTGYQFDTLCHLYIKMPRLDKLTTLYGTYDVIELLGQKTEGLKTLTQVIANATGGSGSRQERIRDALLFYSAEYSTFKERGTARTIGINYLLNRYPNNFQSTAGASSSNNQKSQAEKVYYRLTGKFMPGMSEARQRELIDYFKKAKEIANVIVSTEAGTFSY